jgi:hypothetical protein
MDGLGDRITKVEAKVQTHGDNIEAIKKDTGTVVPPKQPQS